MKWLFVGLLVANIALFGWLFNREPDLWASDEAALRARQADHINKLLLLDEVGYDELRPRVQSPIKLTAVRPPTSGTVAPVASVCFSVGPLSEQREIDRVKQWLESRGGTTRLRLDERRELALFWVFLPPFASRDAAQAQVREMKSKGIDDIFTIQRGDMSNAVSLGVYSRRTSLERRLGKLRAHGYDPAVVPRYRTKKATWFDARFAAGFQFPGERFSLAFPGIEATDADCATVMPSMPPQPPPASGEVTEPVEPVEPAEQSS